MLIEADLIQGGDRLLTPENGHSPLWVGSPISDHRSVRLNASQPCNHQTI